jgi:probable rRNA maturation factor
MPYDVAIDLVAPAPEVDVPALEAMIAEALAADGVDDGATLAVLLTGDDEIRALNLEHRDADEPTDVLSFPADEGEAFPGIGDVGGEAEPRYLGDIAISLETVRRQAAELGLAFDLELRHVALHGVLHLLGYDHLTPGDEAAMRGREERVLGPEIHADERRHED